MTVCIAKRSVSDLFGFKCRLGLPVVREVRGVVTMKTIDMYIHHDSSLVVCFSNISAYFAQREVIKVLRSGARVKVKVKVVAGSFTFARMRRVGVGRHRVLVFGLSGVMISIKSIDLHIGHGRSVYIAKRL